MNKRHVSLSILGLILAVSVVYGTSSYYNRVKVMEDEIHFLRQALAEQVSKPPQLLFLPRAAGGGNS